MQDIKDEQTYLARRERWLCPPFTNVHGQRTFGWLPFTRPSAPRFSMMVGA